MTGTNRKMTPGVLAQADGVLAVFVGLFVDHDDGDRWRPVAKRLMDFADVLMVDDLTLRIGDAQVVRLLAVDDLQCVVVYNPDSKVAKSLPRSMRRCIAHVRAERRNTEREGLSPENQARLERMMAQLGGQST